MMPFLLYSDKIRTECLARCYRASWEHYEFRVKTHLHNHHSTVSKQTIY